MRKLDLTYSLPDDPGASKIRPFSVKTREISENQPKTAPISDQNFPGLPKKPAAFPKISKSEALKLGGYIVIRGRRVIGNHILLAITVPEDVFSALRDSAAIRKISIPGVRRLAYLRFSCHKIPNLA